eukprot:GHVQ01023420.1.p1 GENE.GHVQ01023420.1~~GHVQ01023420.1.p1  ORF type:complete len:176 (-),score=16.74 GHVQ01023420.1:290-817(-)
MFHMSHVKATGMSRMAMAEISRAFWTISVFGCLVFIILVITSIVQLAMCYLCTTDRHVEAVFWFLSTFILILAMGCTSPRAWELNELLRTYEQTSRTEPVETTTVDSAGDVGQPAVGDTMERREIADDEFRIDGISAITRGTVSSGKNEGNDIVMQGLSMREGIVLGKPSDVQLT